MNNHVILVDSNDKRVGVMEKMEAHQKGLLHRAFSVFLFNDNNEMLIHQRASKKYHCGGLWTNACCSHPQDGENIDQTIQRKLMQEMGITCPVEKAFNFVYRSELDNGLTEYEFDHVYTGKFSGIPKPNPEEVSDWKYVSLLNIENELANNPGNFTPWFQLLFSPLAAHLTSGSRV
ncbi:MAG TPA: isopentenyl-diphosphate Delta-isomerase [Cryomorphaceae bacterium]|nr:isopentenyl-diphosphate Delta-isomerase [Cryomorphaceae bacterium]